MTINILRPMYLFLIFLFLSVTTFGQDKTIAERLGYPKDAKLLIIHADDIGVTHSEDAASISAYEKGAITSGSIMVPCPWFPEIAAYARKHPKFDLGLHLTLTSEWEYYKWNGVMPYDEIASLVNDSAYFYESVKEVIQNASPKDIEKELKAQIERALAFGIKPTHLDSHMGTLFSTPEFFKIYLKLGKAYHIPLLVPMNWLHDPEVIKMANNYPIRIQNVITLYPSVPIDQWQEAYDNAIRKLNPGLNELVIHLAYDNAEMDAVTIDRNNWWDAAWRQRDYDYITSQRFKDILRKNNIQLITWRQIKKAMYPATVREKSMSTLSQNF